jgi:hypothetical protein
MNNLGADQNRRGEFLKFFSKKFGGIKKVALSLHPLKQRAHSSVGSERLPYKQDVRGSNPCVPTKATSQGWLFLF